MGYKAQAWNNFLYQFLMLSLSGSLAAAAKQKEHKLKRKLDFNEEITFH